MPLIRKLIKIGKTSKGVILPKSWLDYFEGETGHAVIEVAVEVLSRELRIKPIMSHLDD